MEELPQKLFADIWSVERQKAAKDENGDILLCFGGRGKHQKGINYKI